MRDVLQEVPQLIWARSQGLGFWFIGFLRFWSTEREGGGRKTKPGAWGAGSAARSISSTSKGECNKIGTISGENMIVVAPILLPLELVYIFSGSELVIGQT